MPQFPPWMFPLLLGTLIGCIGTGLLLWLVARFRARSRGRSSLSDRTTAPASGYEQDKDEKRSARILGPAHQGKRQRTPKGTVKTACSICQRELTFSLRDMRPLTSPEVALAVRGVPAAVGRALAEYVCPHCEAAYCFAVDAREPILVGINLYKPQTTGARCLQCRKLLEKPSWAPGVYDGRLAEAPNLSPNLGLVCPRCGAVCCVDCCRKATRGRTEQGALMCPRCSRYPMGKVFHP